MVAVYCCPYLSKFNSFVGPAFYEGALEEEPWLGSFAFGWLYGGIGGH
jgi:hypothetical protein